MQGSEVCLRLQNKIDRERYDKFATIKLSYLPSALQINFFMTAKLTINHFNCSDAYLNASQK